MNGRRRLSDFTVATLISFVFLAALMTREVIIFDEGIILSDAVRVLDGDLLHRDFYSNYGPAQYYIVALLLKLTNQFFLAERLYDLLVKSAICGLVFSISRLYCRAWISAAVAGVALLWFIGTRGYLYPIYPCILLSLISTLIICREADRNTFRRSMFLLAGCCAGLTALFRYELGFFLLVADMAGFVALVVLSRTTSPDIKSAFELVVANVAGTALVFVPAAATFLALSPLAPFWHDIIEYPTKYYAQMRGLPFPKPSDPRALAVYMPLVVAALALFHVILDRRRSSIDPDRYSSVSVIYMVMFSSLSVLFYLKGVVRVQALHLLPAIIPSLLVAAALADIWMSKKRNMWRYAAALVLILVGTPAALSAGRDVVFSLLNPERSLLGHTLVGFSKADVSNNREACPESRFGALALLGDDYDRAVRFIMRYSAADAPIFVGLDRHDRIFANPVALYVAAGRKPATHWHQFDPGLQSRADIQALMIDELRDRQVDWIVRDASFENMNEPNGSSLSSGVHLLDRYIEANYRAVAAQGSVEIWLKNDRDVDLSDVATSTCYPKVLNGPGSVSKRPT